jgi:opacity protein-like surface antigen
MIHGNRQKSVTTLLRPATKAKFKWGVLAAATITALISAPAQAAPTVEQQIEMLGKEVDELKQEVAKQKSASAGSGATSIGGYGELHYNSLDSKDEIDFHRFVLFFGHRFNEHLRFFSEVELEHALVKDTSDASGPGEVELEQAYLDFDLNDAHTARAGLFLVPVGILNETHEPPTFYGVERNPVETDVIPTTWWEGGLGLNGRFGAGLGYDLALTSGLKVPTSGSSAYKVRSGRQKMAKADANNAAVTARIKWTGAPGIELATTVHRQDAITQGTVADSVSGAATLWEAHAVFARGPFGLRALYAQWDLDGAGPKALGRDEQKGWYIEPSFKLTPKFGVFARYNVWDNEAGDVIDSEKKQKDFGFNYWPHEQVALKFDIQRQSGAVNDDGFNLGIGYMF